MKNFKEKACIICDKQYKPITGNSKSCSKECAKKREINKIRGRRNIHIITKQCTICEKQFETFHPRTTHCSKECRIKTKSIANAQWQLEKIAKDPFYNVRVALWKNYKITIEERDQIIKDQNNLCLRCFEPLGDWRTLNRRHPLYPVIDHNHSCEIGDPDFFNAIVHSKCNLMLGSHHDCPKQLKLSFNYLENYQWSNQ